MGCFCEVCRCLHRSILPFKEAIDLNKPETKRDTDGKLIRPIEGPVVPEATGVLAGTVYLACMFVFIPVPFMHESKAWGDTTGGGGWGAASGERTCGNLPASSGSRQIPLWRKAACPIPRR